MNGMGATNSAITSGMCMFSIGEKIPFLYNFTTAATIILTLGNGIAIKVVEGGDNNKIFLYEAILAFVVGLEILLVPVIVSHVFTFDI
jgi:archaellum biogenesis protein FlaJ (TadC family)